jgi:hypothetical protein
MSGGSYQVRGVFDEAHSLFQQKNADYGDSWRNHGWRGNLVRILEKADRLQNTLWHSGPTGFAVVDENARETALDMINTLAFFIVNWDERREWGGEETRVIVDEQPRTPPNGFPRPLPGAIIEVPAEATSAALTPLTPPTPNPRPVRDNPQT